MLEQHLEPVQHGAATERPAAAGAVVPLPEPRPAPDDAPVPDPGDGPFAAIRLATILMVDDDIVMLTAVEAFLDAVGYRSFVTTTDPTQTLALIDEHRPDVLLLDLVMPGMSGFDVLAQVRAREATRFLPVIVLSGETDPGARLKALELGATDFLMKPVDPSELQLRVRNTLAFKAYQDRLADYEPVTGLRNRRRFEADLRQMMCSDKVPGGACALLHLDLDRFKHVNDTLGHRAGDQLLNAVARRIEQLAHDVEATLISTAGETDSRVNVAHIAGNGFALIVCGLRDADNAERAARAVLKGFTAPFEVDEQQLFVSASIGISLHPVDARDPDQLLKHAEMAMYQAKRRGRGTHEFFSSEFNARAIERASLEQDLRRAVERAEFQLYYQPKVDVATGVVHGAEALIRWIHPTLGMVSPLRFIPLAEETGLIVEIGRWVLEEAARQCVRWQELALPPVRVSVNVSPAQFTQSAILRDVRTTLASTGLEPDRLVLEVTETLLMANIDEAVALLKAVRALGVRLSVDDFGTGYSSLGYLRWLPLDELKIDRSFVTGLPDEKDSHAIVGAVIAMAHALNLKVVAEGVETERQLAALGALRCDEYQGFLCSKPVPASEFAVLLLERGAQREHVIDRDGA
jgi:diguanylate cyclase (GGDEF)-like protein